jgi:hypothetical protein
MAAKSSAIRPLLLHLYAIGILAKIAVQAITFPSSPDIAELGL